MNLETIKSMMNKSKEIIGLENQLHAVKQDGFAIQFIDNPSEEVMLHAVKQDGWAIQFIHNPSEDVMLHAVKQDGFAIRFIKNPSEDVMLHAVKQNKEAIQFFKQSWFKSTPKKLTVDEIQKLLGYEVEIVA